MLNFVICMLLFLAIKYEKYEIKLSRYRALYIYTLRATQMTIKFHFSYLLFFVIRVFY